MTKPLLAGLLGALLVGLAWWTWSGASQGEPHNPASTSAPQRDTPGPHATRDAFAPQNQAQRQAVPATTNALSEAKPAPRALSSPLPPETAGVAGVTIEVHLKGAPFPGAELAWIGPTDEALTGYMGHGYDERPIARWGPLLVNLYKDCTELDNADGEVRWYALDENGQARVPWSVNGVMVVARTPSAPGVPPEHLGLAFIDDLRRDGEGAVRVELEPVVEVTLRARMANGTPRAIGNLEVVTPNPWQAHADGYAGDPQTIAFVEQSEARLALPAALFAPQEPDVTLAVSIETLQRTLSVETTWDELTRRPLDWVIDPDDEVWDVNGWQLHVRILDVDGTPLDPASLTMLLRSERNEVFSYAAGPTFEGLPTSTTYTLKAEHPGTWHSVETTFPAPTSARTLEVELRFEEPPPPLVHMRLVDPNGEPLAKRWVEKTSQEPSRSYVSFYEDLPRTSDEGELSIQLTTVDLQSGEGGPNANVELGLLVSTPNDSERATPIGRASITIDPSKAVREAAPSTGPSPLTVPELDLGDVVVEPYALLASGRVVDSSGAPLEGVRIQPETDTPGAGSMRIHGPFDAGRDILTHRGAFDAYSDADGRFEVRGTPMDASLRLSPFKTGFAQMRPEVMGREAMRGVELRMERAGSLEGNLSADLDFEGRFFVSIIEERADGALPFPTTQPEFAGAGERFRFADLPPGTYTLLVQPPSGSRNFALRGLVVPMGGACNDRRLVDIDPIGAAQSLTLTARLPAGSRGRIEYLVRKLDWVQGDFVETYNAWVHDVETPTVQIELTVPYLPIDLLVTVGGHQPVELRGVSGDVEFEVEPGWPFELHLDPPLNIRDDTFYGGWVTSLDSRRLLAHARPLQADGDQLEFLFDQVTIESASLVSGFATQPGRHRVFLHLETEPGRLAAIDQVDIVIQDVEGVQGFDVSFPKAPEHF